MVLGKTAVFDCFSVAERRLLRKTGAEFVRILYGGLATFLGFGFLVLLIEVVLCLVLLQSLIEAMVRFASAIERSFDMGSIPLPSSVRPPVVGATPCKPPCMLDCSIPVTLDLGRYRASAGRCLLYCRSVSLTRSGIAIGPPFAPR